MIDVMERSVLDPETQYKVLINKNLKPFVRIELEQCLGTLLSLWKLKYITLGRWFFPYGLFIIIHAYPTYAYNLWWIIWITWIVSIFLWAFFSHFFNSHLNKGGSKWNHIWHIWSLLYVLLIGSFSQYLGLLFMVSYLAFFMNYRFLWFVVVRELKRNRELFLGLVQQWEITVYFDSELESEKFLKMQKD